MIVQAKSARHRAAIRRLHRAAFPTPAEAELVDRLRADGDAVISFVALVGGAVIGHALLSRMTAPFAALGLAPVAVDARHRRRGVAARLIAAAIGRAREAGWSAVFVLGEPAYYRRFGFSARDAKGFDSPYAGPYLMVLSLMEGGLPVRGGRIDYAPAFAALDG